MKKSKAELIRLTLFFIGDMQPQGSPGKNKQSYISKPELKFTGEARVWVAGNR